MESVDFLLESESDLNFPGIGMGIKIYPGLCITDVKLLHLYPAVLLQHFNVSYKTVWSFVKSHFPGHFLNKEYQPA